MALELQHTLFPYRMVLKRKTPVELSITIKNTGSEPTLASFQMQLPRSLGLDKSGFKSGVSSQLGMLAAGEEKRFVFDVYPKGGVGPGEHPIQLSAFTHYRDYSYVTNTYNKNLSLIVDY